MMTARNYDQLSAAIDHNGGFYTCEMAELRDLHGAGKLGVNVIENISEALDHRGLAHTPAPLPLKQWHMVRVYRRSSPVGKLIKAATDIDDRSDEVLSAVTGTKETEIIRKIRELVCD